MAGRNIVYDIDRHLRNFTIELWVGILAVSGISLVYRFITMTGYWCVDCARHSRDIPRLCVRRGHVIIGRRYDKHGKWHISVRDRFRGLHLGSHKAGTTRDRS
jgi:hypothetical protein